jgi:nucleoside phosphorylase
MEDGGGGGAGQASARAERGKIDGGADGAEGVVVHRAGAHTNEASHGLAARIFSLIQSVSAGALDDDDRRYGARLGVRGFPRGGDVPGATKHERGERKGDGDEAKGAHDGQLKGSRSEPLGQPLWDTFVHVGASMTSSVRIVAAFQPELAAITANYKDLTRVLGVGMCEAAARTARLIALEKPSAIVLVGTCGVYPGKAFSLASAVVGNRFRLVDGSHAADHAAFPAPMQVDLTPDEGLTNALAAVGNARGPVATTLAITTDDALAGELAERSMCAFEHLEVFGVAQACALTETPFAAVLGVANVVGSSGRAEWRAHHEAASAAAVAIVEAWLVGLASKK